MCWPHVCLSAPIPIHTQHAAHQPEHLHGPVGCARLLWLLSRLLFAVGVSTNVRLFGARTVPRVLCLLLLLVYAFLLVCTISSVYRPSQRDKEEVAALQHRQSVVSCRDKHMFDHKNWNVLGDGSLGACTVRVSFCRRGSGGIVVQFPRN